MTTGETATPDSLVAAVQEAHENIKSLLNAVAAGGSDKQDAFAELALTVAAHEAAEQQIVHPLTERSVDGDSVAVQCRDDEHHGEEVVDELTNMGVNHPRFDETFAQFREAVLKHASYEETSEHPILERDLSDEASRQAAESFRAAQSVSA
jgi:hypothetical protein